MNATMQTGIDPSIDAGGAHDTAERPSLSPEAQRALQEAAARRTADKAAISAPELGGRGGLEPVRYGDWEVKGLASDF